MTTPPFPGNPGFVGRTAELEKLTEFFASGSASQSANRTALIVGPAAAGKTSLARMASGRLIPYFPDGIFFINAMHDIFPSSGPGGLPRSIYIEILQQLRTKGKHPDLRLLDDDALRNMYHETLSHSQILVIIDEAHSLNRIDGLAPTNSAAGLILIAQKRPVNIQPGLIIELAGFGTGEARQLLAEMTRDYQPSVPPRVLDEIITLADGNPYILTLLTKQVLGSGQTPESALRDISEEIRRRSGAVSRLQASITIAYDTMTEESRHTLRILSAFGGLTFTTHLVSELLNLEMPATEVQVSALMDASLLINDEPSVYHLLLPVQDFARERLLEDEKDDTVRRASEFAIKSLSRRSLRSRTKLARDMWTVEDTLGYKLYVRAVAAFIQHRETKAPLSIAILGRWGTGKTSLMRMVQERLDPRADRTRWTPTELSLHSGSQLLPREPKDFRKRRSPLSVISNFRLKITSRRARASISNLDVLRGGSGTVGERRSTAARHDLAEALSARPSEDSAEGRSASPWRATVWFNPWKYEQSEQIWAGLANEIISQVTERLNERDRQTFWLALNLKRFDRARVRQLLNRVLFTKLVPSGVVAVAVIVLLISATLARWRLASVDFPSGKIPVATVAAILVVVGLVVQAAKLITGNVARSLPFLAAPTMRVSGVGPQMLAGAVRIMETGFVDPDYPSKLGFLDLVQGDVAHVLSLVATEDQPLVVFIDDLDRCSPGTISHVIESINLFLAGDYNNCIFVLGLDASIVAAHIESTYEGAARQVSYQTAGIADLGWSFLEKFVQLPLILPRPSSEMLKTRYMAALLSSENVEEDLSLPIGTYLDSGDVQQDSAAEGGFVGAESTVGPSEDTSDNEIVSKLERAMLVQGPTPATISRVAYEAEMDVFGSSENALRPQTLEAATRLFARLYSDEMAAPSIYKGLTLLESRNPREIKRYLNLFRFYSFLSEQRRLQEDIISWDEVAKVAALVIRWPQMLGLLLLDSGDSAVLGRLERWIAKNTAETATKELEWRHLLFECGIVKTETDDADKRLGFQLYAFLSAAPEFGHAAAMLL